MYVHFVCVYFIYTRVSTEREMEANCLRFVPRGTLYDSEEDIFQLVFEYLYYNWMSVLLNMLCSINLCYVVLVMLYRYR